MGQGRKYNWYGYGMEVYGEIANKQFIRLECAGNF
jgi:hypothetical protein